MTRNGTRTKPRPERTAGTTISNSCPSACDAPGGIGKSCKALGIATEIATGQAFLNGTVYGSGLRALYINAEDGRVEMLRRLWGFCIEYGLTEQDLARLIILGADDGQVQRISFLRVDKTSCHLDQSGIDAFDTLLSQVRPDLVILDPLVSLCAGANMNDNAAMALVMKTIKQLATKLCSTAHPSHKEGRRSFKRRGNWRCVSHS